MFSGVVKMTVPLDDSVVSKILSAFTHSCLISGNYT